MSIAPFNKVLREKDRSEKSDLTFYPKRQENLPGRISLPDEQEELPPAEWIMPDQLHGYIKGRDNDLL